MSFRNNYFTDEPVDIATYPIPDPHFSVVEGSADGKRKLFVGDLHGNGLRNFHTLVNRVFQLNPVQYATFTQLFHNKPVAEWEKLEVQTLINIIASAEVSKAAKEGMEIVFIGDETGDRLILCLINLLLFEKLHDAGFDFKILVSNHGMELVCTHEKGARFDDLSVGRFKATREHPNAPLFRISLTNLQLLIDAGYITRGRVDEIIKKAYLPHLQLLDYSAPVVDGVPGKILLATHAPSGNKLQGLAIQLETLLQENGQDWQLSSLPTTNFKERVYKLKRLNEAFDAIKALGKIHELYIPGSAFDGLTWERYRDLLKEERDYKNYSFTNGHDDSSPTNLEDETYELDCYLGKGLGINCAPHHLLYSYNLFGKDLENFIAGEKVPDVGYAWNRKMLQIQAYGIADDFNQVIGKKSNGTIDFLTHATNLKTIHSAYQINYLEYLLADEKNHSEFVALFKDNSGSYNNKTLIDFINIINQGELHTLLDIIYQLMNNPLFADHKQQILPKLLDNAVYPQFLKKFAKLLYLVNEFNKHLNLDKRLTVDIINILDDADSDKKLTTFYRNLQENLANMMQGHFIDYEKLTKNFQGAELNDAHWMVKMLSLYCIDWNAAPAERVKKIEKLISCLVDMKKAHEFAAVLEALPAMIYQKPKTYLKELFNLMMDWPNSAVKVYMFTNCLQVAQVNGQWLPESAARYTRLVDLLSTKYNLKFAKNDEALSLLFNAHPDFYQSCCQMLDSEDLNEADRTRLAKAIFADPFLMDIFLALKSSFDREKEKNQFSTVQDILDFIESIRVMKQDLQLQNEQLNVLNSVLSKLLPRFSIAINKQLMVALADLLQQSILLEQEMILDFLQTQKLHETLDAIINNSPTDIASRFTDCLKQIIKLPTNQTIEQETTALRIGAEGEKAYGIVKILALTFMPKIADKDKERALHYLLDMLLALQQEKGAAYINSLNSNISKLPYNYLYSLYEYALHGKKEHFIFFCNVTRHLKFDRNQFPELFSKSQTFKKLISFLVDNFIMDMQINSYSFLPLLKISEVRLDAILERLKFMDKTDFSTLTPIFAHPGLMKIFIVINNNFTQEESHTLCLNLIKSLVNLNLSQKQLSTITNSMVSLFAYLPKQYPDMPELMLETLTFFASEKMANKIVTLLEKPENQDVRNLQKDFDNYLTINLKEMHAKLMSQSLMQSCDSLSNSDSTSSMTSSVNTPSSFFVQPIAATTPQGVEEMKDVQQENSCGQQTTPVSQNNNAT